MLNFVDALQAECYLSVWLRTNFDRKMRATDSASVPTSKRLLFDRRYGWVIDEWKDPSEEALSGGRGMFCILPLARALFKVASQSINVAASSAVKALEKPDLFSPQALQAGLNNELDKIKMSLANSEISTLFHKRNVSLNDASCDSDVQMEKQ